MVCMNKHVNLQRLEFIVTFRCASRCEHCSVCTDTADTTIRHMDLTLAKKAITDAQNLYGIKSLMTFGGEPLLFADFTAALHRHAAELGVMKRQLITSGYFSPDPEKIKKVVRQIKDCGVNSVLVSVDCFHEKHLDYETVERFLQELKNVGVQNVKLCPAWVVNKQHDNPYNARTKELLAGFEYLGFPEDVGNDIAHGGRATENLKEYLPKRRPRVFGNCTTHKYRQPIDNVEVLLVRPNGDVCVCGVIGSLQKNSLPEIIAGFDYSKNEVFAAVARNGSEGIYEVAAKHKIPLKEEGYFSVCDLCRDIRKKLYAG